MKLKYSKDEIVFKKYIEKGYINVLSLTGGGIYGFVQALILDKLDNFEKFDILAGTSIGGINSLLLATKNKGKLVDFYLKYTKEIFKPQSWIKSLICGLPTINDKNIERPLQEIFDLILFKDTDVPVFTTAYNIEMGKPKFFWSEDEKDGQIPIWRIARATSAAPTIFSPIKINNDDCDYSDGGVFCNDPIACVCVQIHKKYNIPFDKIRVCGIGTGLVEDEMLNRPSNPSRYYQWLKIILTDMTRGNSIMHRYIARQLLEPKNYLHMDFKRLDYSFTNPKVLDIIQKEWAPQINKYVTAINNF